jgi:hypothetical protein
MDPSVVRSWRFPAAPPPALAACILSFTRFFVRSRREYRSAVSAVKPPAHGAAKTMIRAVRHQGAQRTSHGERPVPPADAPEMTAENA